MSENELDEQLTTTEAGQLAEAEATIAAGLQTFYDVGAALLSIRDARLYRRDFPTFEAYCRGRWQMGASRARQLIGAAGVVANLEGVTNVTPTNEAQARELAALAADAQQTVWAFAVDAAPVVDGRPRVTATLIKQAAYTVGLLKAHGWGGTVEAGRALLIDPEFSTLLPGLDAETFAGLEQSILRHGVINPLDAWGRTLLDGHARYFVCMRHGLPFDVYPREFADRDAAALFILESQLMRKNYTQGELAKARAALS